MHTIIDNFAARTIITNNTPGSAQITYPLFLEMVPYRRALILVTAPSLSADLAVSAYQADNASGTSAVIIKDGQGDSLTGTFDSDDNDNMVAMIEVLEGNLLEGYDHIGVNLNANGQNPNISVVVLFTDAREDPVSNEVSDGVAFTVGGLDGASA